MSCADGGVLFTAIDVDADGEPLLLVPYFVYKVRDVLPEHIGHFQCSKMTTLQHQQQLTRLSPAGWDNALTLSCRRCHLRFTFSLTHAAGLGNSSFGN